MKLQELEIQNVRGIRHLVLKPECQNLVVWGPNGSGKSAVVDAIDFLLTGRISRLTGKGTGGLTLGKHGPHVDCVKTPGEAKVRAIVRLPGVKDPIEITRCMSTPNTLDGCGGSVSPALEAVMSLARRGQHVLTRRDILKYITAEAGTRAQQIQELLNVSEIETIRKTLVGVRNDLEKDEKSARRRLEEEKGRVISPLGIRKFAPDAVVDVINRWRALLGGAPIQDLASNQVRSGLKPPAAVADSQGMSVSLLEKDIENLRVVVSPPSSEERLSTEKRLRDLLDTVRAEPRLITALSRVELTRRGLELLGDGDSCPLCDTPWPSGQLREHLLQHLAVAGVAAEHQKQIEALSSSLLAVVNRTIPSIQKVVAAAQVVGPKDRIQTLQDWQAALQELSASLYSAVEKYPHPRLGSERVAQMLAPDDLGTLLEQIQAAARAAFPETTPEQDAWQSLIQVEINLKRLEDADTALRKAGVSHKRGSSLLASFLEARDEVLGRLYNEIKDRFVALYRQLHELDEGQFTATIRPEEAALEMEVDFFGRGTFPPHALHSEGHQDSMGLCLYLALAERLNKNLIELTVLDDVVMSVDADHRRQVCQVLSRSFPDRQFLITTHDKTWAYQLKSEGVVGSKGSVEFYSWDVDNGPQVNYETDLWNLIDADLKKNDVPAAASRLRRCSEQFFGSVCDALQAPVVFRLNGRWMLGDFLPAAIGEYNNLLKQAKKAANSWNDQETLAYLQELQSVAGTIFKRTNAEQWAVNATVHYDNWHALSVKDLRPVVEAFQDLSALFTCTKCGGMVRLATFGITAANVRCGCGKFNWSLIDKGKAN